MKYKELSSGDKITVESQLGRPVRGKVLAVSRCPYGQVEVIATPPLLPDGTPFPTLFWLTCPLLHREVSRLESGDFREVLRRKLMHEPGFKAALRDAEREYVEEREEWARGLGELEKLQDYFERRDGIGGTRAGGIKCLHAHLAQYLAKGKNPVGAEIDKELEDVQARKCEGDCGPFLKPAAGGGEES
jgi:hypothetical protein